MYLQASYLLCTATPKKEKTRRNNSHLFVQQIGKVRYQTLRISSSADRERKVGGPAKNTFSARYLSLSHENTGGKLSLF
jgi:hypothetical protein